MSSKSDAKIVLICGGIALLTVLGVIAGGLYLFITERQFAHFPTTVGEIIENSISFDQIQTSKLQQGTATPKLRYRYSVGGRQYTGQRVDLLMRSYGNSDPTAAEATAKAFLAQYPVGGRVAVFYDPKNPARAILKPGFSWLGLALTAAGTAILLVMGFFFFRRRSRNHLRS